MKYQEMFSLGDNDSRGIILQMIKPHSNVLEFGCATGNMTRYMTEEMECDVCIVEFEKEAFEQAINFASDGICGDILEYKWLEKFNKEFDYIVFADVLEHLTKPQEVLEKAKEVLAYDGSILISVPNIAHNDIVINLLRNQFEYTVTGLLDDTHVHFFTDKSLIDCCKSAGYQIIQKRETVIQTGMTEQNAQNSSRVLKNILSLREGGEIYQNIVELKTKTYCTENHIDENYFRSDTKNRYLKLYFDTGTGYSEENAVFLKAVKEGTDCFCCNSTIELPEHIQSVRIDPLEGESCFLLKAEVTSKEGEAKYEYTNAVENEGKILLLDSDPQLEVKSLDGIKELKIDILFTLEGTDSYVEGVKCVSKGVTKEMVNTLNLQNKRLEEITEKCSEASESLRTIEDIVAKTSEKEELYRKYVELLERNKELEEKVKEETARKVISEGEAAELRNQLGTTKNQLNEAERVSQDYYNRLLERSRAAEYWENYVQRIKKTTSWKVTRPLRAPAHILKKLKEKNMSNRACDIKFSIVMPVYNVEIKWLEKAINSIKNQTYTNWELCIADDASTEKTVPEYLKSIKDNRIKVKFQQQNGGISVATNAAAKMATGQYILLMDNDDEIASDALMEFYQCIKRTGADVVYSDQDIIDTEGNHSCPVCKPNWSPDLFCSQMYLGHLIGFKRELFNEVGGFRKEFDGSQDYDLLLRITEKTTKIEHIDKILYSWRTLPSSTAANPDSKPYAQYAGLNAVQDHLDRTLGKGVAKACETDNLFVYDVKYPLKKDVLISIIIPTKDHAEDLKMAIDSIFEMSDYRNFEIIILNNNSEKKETYIYFEEVKKQYSNVKVEDAFYEFNWSKLNNHGISVAKGDVYLFLNNDVKVLTGDWLERLASQALRPEVGTVGAMLLYEDGTIQHGGVVVGFGGWADHAYKGMQPIHNGTPYISPVLTRNVTAVTGACMAISKDTIEKIGLFDDNFIICGSDVEICIRALQKGLVNVYDPYVRLFHYESKSRGTFVPQVDFELSDKMYAPFRETGDPYYNNNLDYTSFVPKMKGDISLNVPVVHEEYMEVNIPEITPVHFRKVELEKKRLNILLPSLNPEHVFGGIATAYKFFQELHKDTGMDCRIILTDAAPNNAALEKYGKEYVFADSQDDTVYEKMIVPFNDRTARTLAVSDKDYFVFTGWWTAYCIQDEYLSWKNKGLIPNPFVYLIQDYEPGFYQWSSLYMLADATYRTEFEQIAVFNSSELKEYFDFLGYKFKNSYVFEPVLNAGLKTYLQSMDKVVNKKKQILVYGRPNTARNAFALLVQALRRWVEMQPNVSEWRILSAGEDHKKVDLGKGMVLEPVGKLTIDEYARTLEESYAGVSLMVSPHPSYPPLEMSVFGVRVITNSYANKDISGFNDNIISLSDASPYSIAENLREICNNFVMEKTIDLSQNQVYCFEENSFPFIEKIKEELV